MKEKTFHGKPCRHGHGGERYLSNLQCVGCSRAHALARYQEKSDEIKAQARARYYADPAADNIKSRARHAKNRDSELLRMARYRAENVAAIYKSQKAWREANRAHLQATMRAWQKANPTAVRAHSATRRARKIGADGRYTASDVSTLLVKQRGQCAVCRCDIRSAFHVDHVMPLARGGSNHPTNLQLLCAHCNQSKGAKHPVDFMQSRGLLL